MKKIKFLYGLNIALNIAVLGICVIADIFALTKDPSATLGFYLGLLGGAVVISLVNAVIICIANCKLQHCTPRQYSCKALCGISNGLVFGFATATWVTLFEFNSITDMNAGLIVACTYTIILSTTLAIVMGYLLKKEC